MSKTASTPAACPCGATSHDGPSSCPRSWRGMTDAERTLKVDADVVAYLNDLDALLLPRLGGAGSRRATVAELNAYTAEAEAAGRIARFDGEPYSTWGVIGQVTA